MKRTLSLLFLGLAVMLGLSMAAFAQDIITFTGPTSSAYGGYGTGLYGGTLNGNSTEFMCDDATHDISSGDTWAATPWSISQAAVQNQGAFAGLATGNATWEQDATYGPVTGSHTNLQVYSAVAYLANLIFANPNGVDVNGIQYAIWALMDNPPASSDPGTGAFWIAQGLANDTYTNSGITFYSPDGSVIETGDPHAGMTAQEFITDTTPTPEPISMALMGTFLTLAGLGLSKKKLIS
jgi:hypothetical protein